MTNESTATMRAMKIAPLLLVAALWAAPDAWADEIVIQNLDTCALETKRVFAVTSETWSEVKYRERARGKEIVIPALQVVEIRRSGKDKTAEGLGTAVQELGRGNLREAKSALEELSGGGWRTNLESGERYYNNFRASDPPGRNKRPPWTSEYAHYYYVRALVELAEQNKDRDLFKEALTALDDVDVPGPVDDKGKSKKIKSGGFLARFADGNSRWYPNAMLLKARALMGMGRYDDAAQIYAELHKAAIGVPLDPRWAFEAKLGAGKIAEAQKKYTDAETAYNNAVTNMELLLKDEKRNCLRMAIGRYFSRARMRVAAIKLAHAEKRKAATAFQSLRAFIEQGNPVALRKRYGSRLTKDAVDALVAGSRDPQVQAVAQNGIGLAYLNEKKYEDALIAFRSVVVKYFEEPTEPARALYYLAKAADGASKQAKDPEVRAMYAAMKTQALKRLRSNYRGTQWATKGG